MVMHRIIFARGVDPDVDPDPLRHHHRGLGVRLAVRVQPQQRLRERVVRLAALARAGHQLVRQPLAGDVRDHGLGDLEDHAVHVAAPARRPGPDLRGHDRGGEGRRRHLVAAALQGDPPEHAGRDHGRGAVPGARRVPHLRQHLRDDPRSAGHRVLVVPDLPTGHRADAARPRVGALGAAVPLGAAAGVPDRQALQGRPGAGEG